MKDVITIVAFAALVATAFVIRWRVVKAIRDERLHHTKENDAFMARYRAEHPSSSRVTEAPPTPSTLPVIRRRPAGAGNNPSSPAPAGGPPWSQP